MSGWQGKTATTNGVFCRKIPQFVIVKSGEFSYIFSIRCRSKIYREWHKNYGQNFRFI
jgi:hypothetical protein